MTAPSESDVNWYSEETATFGDRVSGAREAFGLTQRELADRLGIKPKTLRAWEQDLDAPRANKLQMLAGVLNVSIAWLINGEGDGLNGPAEGGQAGPDIRAVLAEMVQINEQMRLLSDRLQVLETRLRDQIKEPAE